MAEPDTPDADQTAESVARFRKSPFGTPSPPADDTTGAAVRAFRRNMDNPELSPGARRRAAAGYARTESEQAAANPLDMPDSLRGQVDESRQGVSVIQRLLLKNLSNPYEAASWLRANGKEAYVYQPSQGLAAATGLPMKMRIAVRNPGDDEFRVLDPEGFEPQDLLDHFGDILFGAPAAAASTAAAAAATPFTGGAGAIPAGMAAGAVVGAGTELARQEAGREITQRADLLSRLFGGPAVPELNPEFNTGAIASGGIGGAMALPLGGLAGAVGRGVGKAVSGTAQFLGKSAGQLGRAVGAKIAGIGADEFANAIAEGKAMLAPLNDPLARFRQMPGVLAQAIQQFLSTTKRYLTGLPMTQEYGEAQALLRQHGSGNVRIAPVLQEIKTALEPPSRTYTIPGLRSPTGRVVFQPRTVTVMQKPGELGSKVGVGNIFERFLLDQGHQMAVEAGTAGIDDAIARDATVPSELAQLWKRRLQDIETFPNSNSTDESMKSQAAGFIRPRIRAAIENTLPPAVRKAFRDLNEAAGTKIELANKLSDRMLGSTSVTLPNGRVITGANGPENYIRTFLRAGSRSGQQDLMNEFAARWEPELSKVGLGDLDRMVRGSAAGAALGMEQAGGEIPMIAARHQFGGSFITGGFGATLGGTFGEAVGHPAIGAGVGGMSGAMATTPRLAIRSAMALQRANQIAGRVGGAISGGFGRTAQAAAPFVNPQSIAAAGVKTGVQEAGRQVSEAGRTRNVDAEVAQDVSKMKSEIMGMMAKNPNITQQQAVEELNRRVKAYLDRKKLEVASP